MIRKEKACCFSGHRVIPLAEREQLQQKLVLQIKELIEKGYVDFIVGGALGFDTLSAQAVLSLRDEFPHIRLILALPCRDQDVRWNEADRKLYAELCKLADLVHYCSDSYHLGCMRKRNQFMVDHAACCVFYLTRQRSGTYQTVSYALEQGLQLYNLLLQE